MEASRDAGTLIASTIRPESIVGTMLFIHLVLGVTVWIGALILHSAEELMRTRSFQHVPEGPRLHGTTLFFFFAALAALVFSEELVSLWGVMFPEVTLISFASATSRSIFFLLEVTWFGVIVSKTGGSRDSPFTPMLAATPALAVFLHEPPSRFLAYTALSALVFACLIYPNFDRAEITRSRRYKHSVVFVMLMTLAVSTLTAYVTRPR